MGRTKKKITINSKDLPIEVFKHCIGWNSYNIPRITKNGHTLYSYKNKFILNKNDSYLDKAVSEGYMTKAKYCEKYNIFKLTDKGFKYVEEKENIIIIKDIDLAKLHPNYSDSKNDSIKDIDNQSKKIENSTPKKRGRKKKVTN